METLRQQAAVDAQHEARRARLAEVGALETIGAQFARGALDVVLAPAALAGLVIEGSGALTGADWLEDFGRDFGKAASGGELMGAYMALEGWSRDDASHAVSEYERTKKALHDQEEAWPMLSMASHVAGATAAGLGIAGAAGGASTLRGTIAQAAYEGGGLGAQTAYAKNAALRDVATSALLGAAAGGGLTYGIGKGAQAWQARSQRAAAKAERAAELRAAFGTAEDASARAGVTVESIGGREGQSVVVDLKKARDAAKKAADAVKNPTLREQALALATKEQAELLAKKAGAFDPATWAEKPPSALQKVFYRTQILDKTADDVVATATKVAQARPSPDVPLDVKRLDKLTKKSADAPAAIGQLQSRVGDLMASAPKTAQGDTLRASLRDASSRLMKADLPQAMADAHELVRTLGKVANAGDDALTQQYAQRAAQSLADDMAGEAFGDAGKLYSRMFAKPGQGFSELGDRALVRDALRTMAGRGQLPDIVRAEGMAIAAANDAAAKLTGQAAPKGIAAQLHAAESLMAKAETAVTLDGGPVGRVFDWFKDKVEDKVANAIGATVGGAVGGWPGAMAGNMVANAIKPRIGPVLNLLKELGSKRLPHLPHGVTHAAEHAAREKAVVGAAGSHLDKTKHTSLSQEQKHQQFNERSDSLREFQAATERPELDEGARALDQMAPGLGGLASGDAQERLAQLENDLIRPQPNIRGKAYEVLSSEDLRKNNAMWEATMDPMSVYDDLASGSLDYDKLNYTWKQYPGLLFASQMALTDIVHQHLSDDQRANVPEHILSQLDLAFRMEGGLSKSLDRGFAQRIDQANAQLMAQQQQKPQPQGQLNLPGAKPTPVMRIAGNV